MLLAGLIAGLVLQALWALSRSFFRVEEGHVAVRTTFGKAEHDTSGLLLVGPGLHTKAPWQHVRTVSLKEQNLDLSGPEGGQTALAEDGTVLRFDSHVRFTPSRERLAAWLFGLQRPVEHLTGLFTCLLRNEIANATIKRGALVEPQTATRPNAAELAAYTLILRQRKELNERLRAWCKERIEPTYGVRFDAVDLTDVLPPDELAEALNAVMNAETEAEARLARAEAESVQQLLSAKEGIAIARARATAAETEIRTLARSLAALDSAGTLPLYVERRRAEVLAESRTQFVRRSSR